MKKLPYGVSDYKKLVEGDYYYVDKTTFIEQIENLPEPYITLLRPRKFGKTLFTSTLEYYYDIKTSNEFEKLFSNTYIGKHPTKLKNSYHILRFNFSGIDTASEETTIRGFKNKTIASIREFIAKYDLEFYINENDVAENIFYNLLTAFKIQKEGEKIYVLIDEYDHFANELLSFNTNNFKTLVSKNGKIRKWYEILKEGTESIVDRIFITGVAPITLDSLTSGFNISRDKTKDRNFNEMLGFTKQELIKLMKEQGLDIHTQETLLPIMKENYDGYMFSTKVHEQVYNSNMCLFFLNEYVEYNEIPTSLVDVNIASDYSKLGKMLDLCKGEKGLEILEKTVSGKGIISSITEKFNPEMPFGDTEFASMLFYLGYLTISGEKLGLAELKIPNLVMRRLYSNYFIERLEKLAGCRIDESEYTKILEELALDGKVDALVNLVHSYLSNLSNRDFMCFDEKYVTLVFYCLTMHLQLFSVKSELEIHRNYPDLLLIPKDMSKHYKSIMIELKYLKKEDSGKLAEKQQEAREQIERYSEFEDIKNIPDLVKYTIVAVNDEIYVEKIL